MNCTICKKTIEKYDPEFNHLVIDKLTSVDICQGCIDKFFKWQGELYSRLFPTTALKKRFSKNKI